ncbi:MAG: TolC family protein [Bacteroidaceae bacterium]|nr:TolC family protein [Bacteroidaceae bacterium]
MRHTAILLISIALFANEARGQQWTLDACVDAALHNNVELKNSRLESEMAAEDKAQAFTNYFPQLSATGAGFIGAKDLMRGEMEVPMMGAMPLSMVKKGVLATLTALQPLYTGGQVIVGNKLAALQQEVRALQLEMTAKDVQQNVATYFWRLVALRSNITTLDAVDSQLQEVYRQTEQYLQAGVINRNELLRVQLKREEISSERLRLQNGIELVRMMLAQLCGADMATFDIIPGEIHSPQAPETYFLPADQALINREEVELTERSQRASELQVKMERGKLLPSVAIGASGVYYNMTEKNQGNLVGLATVSIPISEWWGGSHAIRKAQMAAQQSRNTLQDVRQKLQIDILSAWNNLREAYAQIQIAQRSTEQADENLRLSRNQYDAGTMSLTDLLDAVTLYTQSHSRLDTACADYQARIAEYLRKTR